MNGPNLVRIIGIIVASIYTAFAAVILFTYWRFDMGVDHERRRYVYRMCTFGILVGATWIVVTGEITFVQHVGYTLGEFIRLFTACFGVWTLLPLMRKARDVYHHGT